MIIVLLCFSVLLSGCAPSLRFLHEKKRGKYPDTGDFPNTKWACQEIDLVIYMFDYSERYMVGTYSVKDVSYRVVATFEYASFNFIFYSSTEIAPSENDSSMVHCNQIPAGFLYTNYSYQKDTETIISSVVNCEQVDGETIPNTLTFQKAGTITQSKEMRWNAEELDMYLESFSDVDHYFRGEITIDGERCYIHAFEVGNNHYYMLSVENGKINRLKSGTVSPLVRMSFEISEDRIIATVSDECILRQEAYPYWGDQKTITLKPAIV